MRLRVARGEQRLEVALHGDLQQRRQRPPALAVEPGRQARLLEDVESKRLVGRQVERADRPPAKARPGLL